MELTPEQVRVLGCLVEKEATTPDLYPLSSNALVAACNQRSSRDPIVSYDDATVTQTMLSLRERGLARTIRGEGSRVYKHAHALREALGVDGAQLAILSVLMLRGAQTPGELRTRTERQHEFPSLEGVEATLQALAGRDDPLVAVLPRQPGHKEARWMHLLTGEEGLAAAAAAIPVRAAAAGAGSGLAAEVAELRQELAALRERVELLESLLDA